MKDVEDLLSAQEVHDLVKHGSFKGHRWYALDEPGIMAESIAVSGFGADGSRRARHGLLVDEDAEPGTWLDDQTRMDWKGKQLAEWRVYDWEINDNSDPLDNGSVTATSFQRPVEDDVFGQKYHLGLGLP